MARPAQLTAETHLAVGRESAGQRDTGRGGCNAKSGGITSGAFVTTANSSGGFLSMPKALFRLLQALRLAMRPTQTPKSFRLRPIPIKESPRMASLSFV